MKREIKFRGKRVDSGAWVYGYLIETKSNKVDGKHSSYIMERPIIIPGITIPAEWFIRVDPGTVGQYTGLKANGVEIYEGDILQSNNWACLCTVKWEKGGLTIPQGEFGMLIGLEIENHVEQYGNDIKIIGNVYENPELMEKL